MPRWAGSALPPAAVQAGGSGDYPRPVCAARRRVQVPRKPSGDGEPCKLRHDLVAVRDGAILRAPKQEAAYLVVNSATEHVRFRYLHMHPRKMDEENLLSGRFVREGEVIGQVSNYSRK